MGEYVWTVANIGGEITMAQAEKIAALVEGTFGAPDALPCILAAAASGERYGVTGDVNYGNPEALTDYLTEQGIPYIVTYSAAPGCFGSGGYAFIPGGCITQFDADDNGCPSITLDGLRQHLAAGLSLEGIIGLMEMCDERNLPPVKLVEA